MNIAFPTGCPKSILHVVHSLNVGGLERVVLDLASSFYNKGHFLSICCLSEKGDLADEAERAGMAVVPMLKREGMDPWLPLRLRSFIKKNHFDIVHTHNEAGLLYGAAAALLAGKTRIIHTEHGKEPDYPEHRGLRRAEAFLLKRVHEIVTVSEDLRKVVGTTAGIRPDEIHVIRNGIRIASNTGMESKAEIKHRLGIDPDQFVIGHIARLVALKNQKFLLYVFSLFHKKHSGSKLVMIGSGPLEQDLERYSAALGIRKSVVFLGFRKDARELIPAFDLFLLPSLTEGISITLLEAMSAGVPVIAAQVGGNEEIIIDKKSGILLPPDNAEAWMEEMEHLYEHEDERLNLSHAAERTVRKRFSLNAMSDQYEALYHQN